MEALKKLELFFEYDQRIKDILFKIQMDESDKYDIDRKIDKIDRDLDKLELYIDMILLSYPVMSSNDITKMFEDYRDKLYKCKNSNELEKFCINNMTDLSSDFVKNVGLKSCGYSFHSPLSCKDQVKTINELLHMLHMYVTNDFDIYNSINLIDSKINFEDYDINLRGEVNDIGKNIFDNIPYELSSGDIDIIAFSNNKVLIMIRDRGHALVLDIKKDVDHCEIKYHIPKICNVDMVKKLRGLGSEFTDTSKYARGYFETSIDTVGKEIADFISNVPMDSDIVYSEDSVFYGR